MAAAKKNTVAASQPSAKNSLPTEPVHAPGAFLDLPPGACSYEGSRVVVLPMPLEESVSYGGGTAAGPAAIITASQQVELYDPRLEAEPALAMGIHTLPPPAVFNNKQVAAADALAAIARETALHLEAGKFVLALGGEHTASLAVAQGVARALGDFTVVHIDAHADLRDSYQDNPLSHACVIRRIAELPQCRRILQLGIRSTTREQVDFCREHSGRKASRPRISTWYSWDMHGKKDWRRQFARLVKDERVFFTFDVDGLDPAIVPATGTPEPDGLSYRQLMRIVKLTAKHARTVVALDCVELAPAPGLAHADFTVARSLYEMLAAFVKWQIPDFK